MWTIKLLQYYQVPSDFHEPFIISGYRACRSSVSSCLVSAVHRSNETLNFWTHFLSFLGFAWITWCHVGDGSWLRDPFSWPLVCFLLSSCLYMVLSAFAHLFNCLSLPARYVTFFLDYGAISMYSLGASIAYYAYIFPADLLHSSLYNVYLPVAMFAACFCTFLACYSRFSSWEAMRHSGRLPAFMIPYIWCSIPLMYRLMYCDDPDCSSPAMLYHVRQFLAAFILALLYGTRFPEVLAPGKFDVVGHSHQLFHIGGSVATYAQYCALVLDIEIRRGFLVEAVGEPTVYSTFAIFLSVLIGNMLIILGFSWYVTQPHALDYMQPSLLEGMEEEVEAESSRNGAEPIKNGAEFAKNGAEPTKNGAEFAKNGAEPTKNGAEFAKSRLELARYEGGDSVQKRAGSTKKQEGPVESGEGPIRRGRHSCKSN